MTAQMVYGRRVSKTLIVFWVLDIIHDAREVIHWGKWLEVRWSSRGKWLEVRQSVPGMVCLCLLYECSMNSL